MNCAFPVHTTSLFPQSTKSIELKKKYKSVNSPTMAGGGDLDEHPGYQLARGVGVCGWEVKTSQVIHLRLSSSLPEKLSSFGTLHFFFRRRFPLLSQTFLSFINFRSFQSQSVFFLAMQNKFPRRFITAAASKEENEESPMYFFWQEGIVNKNRRSRFSLPRVFDEVLRRKERKCSRKLSSRFWRWTEFTLNQPVKVLVPQCRPTLFVFRSAIQLVFSTLT